MFSVGKALRGSIKVVAFAEEALTDKKKKWRQFGDKTKGEHKLRKPSC